MSEFTLEQALELVERHAKWHPDTKSVSRTLVCELARLRQELSQERELHQARKDCVRDLQEQLADEVSKRSDLYIEIGSLHQQLAAVTDERDAIKRTRAQEEAYDSMCSELMQARQRIADYEFAAVRKERSIVQSALDDNLEQQCEEIRNGRFGAYETHQQAIDALLRYIDELLGESYAHSQDDGKLEREIVRLHEQLAELRRPSDAKEISQIQERDRGFGGKEQYPWATAAQDRRTLLHALAESQRLLKTAEELRVKYHSAWVTERTANENLGYQLADAQRDNARLQADNRRRVDGLEAECQRWNDRLSTAQAEIARLQSPPEERRDIVDRQHARYELGFGGNQYCGPAMEDINTLLEDHARYRNSHVILLLERDAARDKCERLEKLLQQPDINTKNKCFARLSALIGRPTSIETDQPCIELAIVDEVTKRIEHIESALREAIEDIQSWGGYASAYFQDKHDLQGCVARYRAILTKETPNGTV